MKNRRNNSIRNNIDTYLFVLIITILFHIDPNHWFNMNNFEIATIEISYLFVIYSGYKFGKYWGAITGGISVCFWTVLLATTGKDVTILQYVFSESSGLDIGGFYIGNFSIENIFLYSFVGFCSGYVCDVIESFLYRHRIKLTDLLPFNQHNFILSIGNWIERTSRALFLFQIDPEDKKGILKRRLRKIFIIFATLPLVALFLLLSLNLCVTFAPRSEYALYIHLVPSFFSPVVALWLSYRISKTVGVWLSVTFLLSPLVYLYLSEVSEISNHFSLYNPTPPLSIVLSLGVAAWAMGLASEQVKILAQRTRLWVNP